MTTRSAPAGGAPPADVLRLLSLLSRRGGAIAHAAAAAGAGSELVVATAAGRVGAVTVAVWRAALARGLVHVAEADGAGRISAAGLALLRRARSTGGAPGAAGVGKAEASPVARDRAPGGSPSRAAEPRPDAPLEAAAIMACCDRPVVDLDESPLAWLARRRDKSGRPLIEAAEFDAGERFRADFHFAQLGPRVTANWSLDTPRGRTRRAGGPAPVELRDNVVAAQERVRRALAAVGPELAGVLIDVCGHLKGLEHTERSSGWPARSGKVVLQLALQALARHYGLKPHAGRAGGGACRHWGTDGYRPTMDG